jgi:hypothetical protein
MKVFAGRVEPLEQRGVLSGVPQVWSGMLN